MNSVQKLSVLPKRFPSNIKFPVEVLPSRRLGISAANNVSVLHKRLNPLEVDMEQTVTLNSPKDLKDAMGLEKYVAEKRGNKIIAFAATQKLLSEEKLRKTISSFNVPLDYILRENRRWKPSTVRSICPVIQEEL